MHEYEHGELKSGRAGKGGRVKSRKQAVAIALNEAGASKNESASENRKHQARSERKEVEGKTYQQQAEGKSHIGAEGQRESTKAMGGKNATQLTKRGSKAAHSRARRIAGKTKDELYEDAKSRGVEDRSKMTKQQLENALHRR
jgi:hypothetical protein